MNAQAASLGTLTQWKRSADSVRLAHTQTTPQANAKTVHPHASYATATLTAPVVTTGSIFIKACA